MVLYSVLSRKRTDDLLRAGTEDHFLDRKRPMSLSDMGRIVTILRSPKSAPSKEMEQKAFSCSSSSFSREIGDSSLPCPLSFLIKTRGIVHMYVLKHKKGKNIDKETRKFGFFWIGKI